MDVQRTIASRFDSDPDYLPRLRQTVSHARATAVTIGQWTRA
jgi:hypothetical protein